MVVTYFISQNSSCQTRTISASGQPTRPHPPATGSRRHKLLVPPGVGVPRLVAVEFDVAGELFSGSFSLSPTLIRSVVKPFSDLMSFTVVPLAWAILSNVSPVLTR